MKWLDNFQNGGKIKDERLQNLTSSDNTSVAIPEFRGLKKINVRNKTDKEIAAERQAKIDASVKAQDKPIIGNPKWREVLAEQTNATGDKLRVSNEPNFFDDYLNPGVMIGNMASSLGSAPQRAKEENSVMPYVSSIGTPLITGAIGGIGAKNTKQFVNNLTNPLAGIERPNFLNRSKKPPFKSEIDWSKWNKEIPDNIQLMEEYNTIEQQSKANGTWMKNSDGSPFQGTPEQFVQQNSQNFKKVFPNGINKVYRGVGPANNNPDFSKGFIQGDKAIFTADKNLAQSYAWGKQKENILTPFSSSTDSGIYELGFPKGDQITYNTMLSDWTDVNLAKGSSKLNLEINLEQQKKALGRYLKNYEGSVDDDLISYTENRIKQLEQYVKDFDNIPTNHEELKKMRNVLGDTPSTDEIAAYLPNTNLNNITLQNVIDGGLGDVTIVNNRVGNYLKSLRGNNGMFDMTNPNIYKSILPVTLGIGAASQLEEKPIPGMKQGGVIKDDNGYWNPDNWGKTVEIGSGNITMEGVNEPLIGISKQTGEKKLMLPEKNYKFANTKQVVEYPIMGWMDKYK